MSRIDLVDMARQLVARPGNWNPRSPRAADGSQALTAWFDSSASGGVQTDGAVSFTAACKHCLSCPDNATVSATTVLEIGCWVYLDSTATGRIVSKGVGYTAAAATEYVLAYDSSASNFVWKCSNGSTLTTVTDTGTAPTTGVWYFLRCGLKADGTAFIQRNNGTEITASSVPNIQDAAGVFGVGGITGSFSYLSGRIDSLYLTKTISSAAEATALYNAGAGRTYADLTSANGLATFATNLVSWYDMDQETGTRYDSKGTNHLVETFDELVTNGTFTGASTGWTEGTGWAYGTNNEAATAATGNLTQSLAAVAAKKYDIKFTIAVTSGSVRYTFGGVTGTTRDATGTFYERATATSTASLVIDPVADFTGTLDDVSIKSAEIVRAAGIAKSDATTATSLGAELLTNGGFETAGAGGADVWGTWVETAGSGTVANETAAIKAGLDAAKLSYATGQAYILQAITTTALTKYRLTFWTRGDGTRAGQYRIYDSTNSANIVAATTTGVTGTTYTQVNVEFTTPAGCVTTSIMLYSPTAAGDAYFDDVSLKQVFAGRASVVVDQSGAGNHLTQATDGYRPVLKLAAQNARAGLDFDGSDDVLSNAADLIGAGDRTLMFVCAAEGWGESNNGRLLDNSKMRVYVNNSGYLTATSDASTTVNSGASSIALATPYTIIITRTSTGVLNYYINGVASGSTDLASGTPAAGSPTYFGSNAALDRSFNGNIYTICAWNVILTPAQIQSANQYAKSRWGTA